ncbi:hypothetical protein QVD17_16032 [Tagetes erecta]|uniref:Calcium uniporter protein C-terminal domain-containing protein n=1 Tax=Tagetes erecta TaxID=13708 RepID=A0AAD8KQ78_TARER|nr:hypothetical protein QVD17_16032 [Tagetes erecta]
MALRSAIAKRLYTFPSSQKALTTTIPNLHHQFFTSQESSSSTRFVKKNFHRRETNQPTRFNLSDGFSVCDARKIMRCSQLQNVRSTLKLVQTNSIAYSEYVNICVDACSNRDQGLEFAKVLDVAGDVLVLGNIVFLRPDQTVISQSIETPNDPRKQELEELERQMALIKQKAISQVRCELYFGLGFLILQTLGFIRLTFWELSWDVMEPICFFVTSFHFALAYMFFLKTSINPTFKGYFQWRVKAKQMKLAHVHKFDYERYHELCNVFYIDNERKTFAYELSSFGKIKKGI